MRQVPGGIVKLRTCKRLGLSSNGLKELPEALEGMEALETLDLYNNQLRKLAAHFDLVKHLRKVYVKDSGISPAETERLRKSLPSVEFSEELPKEIYLHLH